MRKEPVASRWRWRRRQGVTVLETVLALPIVLIALMALVQFGLLTSSSGRLASATNLAAAVASRTSLPSTGPVPATIESAAARELANSNITLGRILVEHNVGPAPVSVLSSGALACTAAADPIPTSGPYVRVTICAESTDLAPNLLAVFGLDLSSRVSQHTVTRRYQRPLP